MGLHMKAKQAVTREYRPRYQEATKKEKKGLLDEFTRLTGYHRKSAVRLLSEKPVKCLVLYGDGGAVKLKLEKKRPGNRKGKRVYSDEVIASLRLIWTFFWNKCGRKRSFRRYSRRLCGGRGSRASGGQPFTSRRKRREN